MVKEMVRIVEETSAKTGGEYTTIDLTVTRSGDRTFIKFKGYTKSGALTRDCQTLEEVETLIFPDKVKLEAKAKELREELARVEALAGSVK